MKAIFELAWRQWDRKISELEDKAGLPVNNEHTGTESASIEARYLGDIVRQNVSEMKELRLKLAELTAANERHNRIN